MSNDKSEIRSDQPIIRFAGVSKSFGDRVVLDNVDLAVRQGLTTAIIGPSGCGKTVLLKTIAGLIKPDSGEVFYREQEISGLSERELIPVRRHMGFVFQDAALFDSMTVEQNISFPLETHGAGDAAQRIARCHEVLVLVGLDGLGHRYPAELSGGQKKRVGLARAIALDPEVILYDEPTTGLDPIRADLIDRLIAKLQRVLGSTAIVVTHDMNTVRKIADRVLMLHDGRFIADSTPAGLGQVKDDVVARFVQGRASPQELAELGDIG
jgi:phospholipid/cholesterol/gamma-HCH transport system ATP-binding protein